MLIIYHLVNEDEWGRLNTVVRCQFVEGVLYIIDPDLNGVENYDPIKTETAREARASAGRFKHPLRYLDDSLGDSDRGFVFRLGAATRAPKSNDFVGVSPFVLRMYALFELRPAERETAKVVTEDLVVDWGAGFLAGPTAIFLPHTMFAQPFPLRSDKEIAHRTSLILTGNTIPRRIKSVSPVGQGVLPNFAIIRL